MGIDGKRTVTVDKSAEVSAAAGSHEIIQRKARIVYCKPCSIIDSEIFPIKCQRISIRIRMNNGEQRIIGRAVLDGRNACFIKRITRLIATKIILRIRQERIQNGQRIAVINTPVLSVLNSNLTAILRRKIKILPRICLMSVSICNGLIGIICRYIKSIS